MTGYIVVPQSQSDQQPQPKGNGSSLAMIIIAVLFGAMGALGGYHAGITRNDIAVSRLREKADNAAKQYANCQAWVETQNARVRKFYSDYTRGTAAQ